MSKDRENQAMKRIEAAFTRIEQAARVSAKPAEPAKPSYVNDPKLVDKHERLRARVSEALTQVDALIGRLGR